jgi:hypothetical protein
MNTAMALVVVLGQAPAPAHGPVGSVTVGATSTYRLVLQFGERDYAIAPLLRPGSYVFEMVSDHPPLVSRIAASVALRPGTYTIDVVTHFDDADRTVVFSLPVQAGQFVFLVNASGKARYDFLLDGPAGSERVTFIAPQKRYSFRAAFARPRNQSRRRR